MHKIKTAWIIIVIFILNMLDVTGLNYVKISGAKPDFVLIAVLFFALYGGPKRGALAGSIAGLIRDVFSGGVFGMNLLFLASIGVFFGYNFSKFYRERPFVQCILIFLSCFAYVFFNYGFLKLMEGARNIPLMNMRFWPLIIKVGIPFSLYTVIFAPLLFFALRKIFRVKY